MAAAEQIIVPVLKLCVVYTGWFITSVSNDHPNSFSKQTAIVLNCYVIDHKLLNVIII